MSKIFAVLIASTLLFSANSAFARSRFITNGGQCHVCTEGANPMCQVVPESYCKKYSGAKANTTNLTPLQVQELFLKEPAKMTVPDAEVESAIKSLSKTK